MSIVDDAFLALVCIVSEILCVYALLIVEV